jgi:hypothetical protein
MEEFNAITKLVHPKCFPFGMICLSEGLKREKGIGLIVPGREGGLIISFTFLPNPHTFLHPPSSILSMELSTFKYRKIYVES